MIKRRGSSSGSLSQLTESEPLDLDNSEDNSFSVTISPAPSSDAPGAAESDADMVGLYGEWQTESYQCSIANNVGC